MWLDAIVGAGAAPDAAAGADDPSRAWTFTGRSIAVAVSVLGLLVRAYAAGTRPSKTSDRLVGRYQAAALNVTGLYSLARHPLYAANALIVGGIAAYPLAFAPIVAFGLYAVVVYGSMAVAEDAYLRERFGLQHSTWAEHTPIFGVAFARWRPPLLPGDARTVVRREYSTWLAFVVVLIVMHSASGHPDSLTAALLDALPPIGLAMVCAGVVKLVKYRTRWLHVEGR